MFANLQTLIKLPVFTLSDQKVGVVHDLEIDVETHAIRHYIVESGIISKDYYWVAPSQVVSIDNAKMIVEDAIITDAGLKVAKGDAPSNVPAPVS